jgi:hypothetical protein
VRWLQWDALSKSRFFLWMQGLRAPFGPQNDRCVWPRDPGAALAPIWGLMYNESVARGVAAFRDRRRDGERGEQCPNREPLER